MDGNILYGNIGYKINDFYIKPKHSNLKLELLTNIVCTLEKNQYDDLYDKAFQHFGSDYALSLKGTKFDLNTKSLIHIELELHHLMVMMIYCNYTDMQYELSKTYRRIPSNENITNMKQRHNVFGNFGKWLKEISYFGIYTDYKSSLNNFYHGVNRCLVFSKTCASFKSPTSTSDNIVVCMTFAANDGMIINLHSGHYIDKESTPRCFDCAWLSDYGNESEKFFIAQWNAATLDFVTIIFTSNGQDFKYYIMAMDIINLIFGDVTSKLEGTKQISNYSEFDLFSKTDKVNLQELAMKLIQNELSFYLPKQYKKYENCPIFIQQMVHKYFLSMNEMLNLWDWIFDDESWIGYQIVISTFFGIDISNRLWWRLDLLTLIMPNLTKLVFINSSKMNDKIMEYIISVVSNLPTNCKLKEIFFLKDENDKNNWFDVSKLEFYNQKFKNKQCKTRILNQIKYGTQDAFSIIIEK
eukprot:524552_1